MIPQTSVLSMTSFALLLLLIVLAGCFPRVEAIRLRDANKPAHEVHLPKLQMKFEPISQSELGTTASRVDHHRHGLGATSTTTVTATSITTTTTMMDGEEMSPSEFRLLHLREHSVALAGEAAEADAKAKAVGAATETQYDDDEKRELWKQRRRHRQRRLMEGVDEMNPSEFFLLRLQAHGLAPAKEAAAAVAAEAAAAAAVAEEVHDDEVRDLRQVSRSRRLRRRQLLEIVKREREFLQRKEQETSPVEEQDEEIDEVDEEAMSEQLEEEEEQVDGVNNGDVVVTITDECDVDDTELLGDGWCNNDRDVWGDGYNTLECGWDGGDCCWQTCRDGSEFWQRCGSSGYHCRDPRFSPLNTIYDEDGERDPQRTRERQALKALLNATMRDFWDDYDTRQWLNTHDHCYWWNGIPCTGGKGYVWGIALGNLNLTGSLPTEIGDFEHLTLLHLYGNDHLSGTIPPSLGNLTKLEYLNVSGTSLSGPIPANIMTLIFGRPIEYYSSDNTDDYGELSPDMCADVVAWVDANGHGCDSYVNNTTSCATDGEQPGYMGYTAYMACCNCGPYATYEDEAASAQLEEEEEKVDTSTDGVGVTFTYQCNVSDPLWLGDGRCFYYGGRWGRWGDEYNTAECGWDGGDCCWQTCRDGEDFKCGDFLGYDCRDPRFSPLNKFYDEGGEPDPQKRRERQALRALFEATKGDEWGKFNNLDDWVDGQEQWLNETIDHCYWDQERIGCTGGEGYVWRIGLSGNNLNGTLPTEIGDLVHLKRLDLRGNEHLFGTIPFSMGNLTKLTELSVYYTSLSGPVPANVMVPIFDTPREYYSPNKPSWMPDDYAELSPDDCADVVGWFDANGHGCAFYMNGTSSCATDGALPGDWGHTADKACCICGPYSTYEQGKDEGEDEGEDNDDDEAASEEPEEDVRFSVYDEEGEPDAQRKREREALKALYNATNGDGWDEEGRWLNESLDHCHWDEERIRCTNGEGYVDYLNFDHANLNGTLPNEIGEFVHLYYLDLEDNLHLSGTIPASMGNLTKLTKLDFSTTSVSGTVPANLMMFIFPTPGSYYSPSNRYREDKVNKVYAELSPDNCADVVGWLDESGNGCDLYRGDIFSCATDETRQGNIGHTADMACCACGLYGRYNHEREVLEELYGSTNGVGWYNSNWWMNSSTSHCYYWTGIQCNDDGMVANIILPSNNLKGRLPSRIGELSSLRILDVSDNSITGGVPTTIGNLTSLQILDVSDINGTIPTELYSLTTLEGLHLRNVSRSGTVSTQVSSLTLLRRLDLSNNELGGPIPVGIADLSLMEDLRLSYNQLNGKIPPELRRMGLLKRLDLDHNRLEGSIPVDVGLLSLLRELRISSQKKFGDRNLSGPIPVELGDLQYLEVLDLSNNELTGVLPTELARLTRMKSLLLQYNNFEGYIPSEYGLLPNLEFLMLGNSLSSREQQLKPAPLSLCFNEAFYLQSDPFWCPPERNVLKRFYDATGGDRWSNLSNWIDPYSDHCSWYGVDCDGSVSCRDVPNWTDSRGRNCVWYGLGPSLCKNYGFDFENGNHTANTACCVCQQEKLGCLWGTKCKAVTSLSLNSNGLSGSIPREIGMLSSLKKLNLNKNRLVGSIPTELTSLSELRELDLAHNTLSGTFAPELGTRPSLSELVLSNNRMSGPIDMPSNNYSNITKFHVAQNEFTGDASTLLRSLSTVQDVDLSHNDFSGSISTTVAGRKSRLFLGGNARLKSPAPSILCHDHSIEFDLQGSPLHCPEAAFLEDLYVSTFSENSGGVKWYRENKTTDVCNDELWIGVKCDASKSIIEINLAENNLRGTLPSSIGNLQQLRVINLANNNLIGSIPPTVWTLQALRHLDLSNNSLTGRLPAIISTASELQTILLSNNLLSGQMPMQIQEMITLTSIDLSGNMFTGQILSHFHSKLRRLYLAGNNFFGKAPLELCKDGSIVFDLQEEAAWCTANSYKDDATLWLSAIAIGICYILALARLIIRILKRDEEHMTYDALISWIGIYLPRGASSTEDSLRRPPNTSIYSSFHSLLGLFGGHASATPPEPSTAQSLRRFSFVMLLLQIGLAFLGGIISSKQSIVEAAFAISGLLGWLFALLTWASSLPLSSRQWSFGAALVILPPAALIGLVTQEDVDFVGKFFLFLITLYLSWSIPCAVVCKVMRNILLLQSSNVDISTVAIAFVKRFLAGLAPVFFFSMRAIGSFIRASQRQEGESWFHEKHLEGWVSVFSGLVLLLTLLSTEVAQLAHLSVQDIIEMRLTLAEICSVASNFALVAVAITLETVVTKFEETLARAVTCALIVGPLFQLFSLWAVSRDVLLGEHAYLRDRRSREIENTKRTRDTCEQESMQDVCSVSSGSAGKNSAAETKQVVNTQHNNGSVEANRSGLGTNDHVTSNIENDTHSSQGGGCNLTSLPCAVNKAKNDNFETTQLATTQDMQRKTKVVAETVESQDETTTSKNEGVARLAETMTKETKLEDSGTDEEVEEQDEKIKKNFEAADE